MNAYFLITATDHVKTYREAINAQSVLTSRSLIPKRGGVLHQVGNTILFWVSHCKRIPLKLLQLTYINTIHDTSKELMQVLQLESVVALAQ